MTETSRTLAYLSPELSLLKATLDKFVVEECQVAEKAYKDHMMGRIGNDRWTLDAIPPCIEQLKCRARELGLWNLFLPKHQVVALGLSKYGPQQFVSNREYALFCESMGRSFLAPEACNCSAPDTGNMEVLLQFGSDYHRKQYLEPLLDGSIRSTFLMTEPRVASSDASNIETCLSRRETDDTNEKYYVLNGRKWWSTGAMDPRCQVAIILAKMEDDHTAASHTVVVLPMSRKGIILVRPLTVFGHDDAPHGHAEVLLQNVIVYENDLIVGEGKGMQIAQARLGPGRVHHCMRAIGLAARCYELMLERCCVRTTFQKKLYHHGMVQQTIADSFMDLQSARLLTLNCALHMDLYGNKAARDQIALIKIAIPAMTFRIVDRAIQMYGGAGVSSDTPLAEALVGLRCLRIADGPDEVHKRTLAKIEIKKHILTSKL